MAAAFAPHPGSAQTSTGAGSLWERDGLTGDWGGLRTRLADAGVGFGFQEQSEVWGNAAGGLSRGGAYDGLSTASLASTSTRRSAGRGRAFSPTAFRSTASDRRRGSSARCSWSAASRPRRAPSSMICGSSSSCSAASLSLRLGQEGANDELMLSQYAGLFLNSSFGYPALLALDLPSGGPNYPLATPFVRAQFQANREITLIGAVYTDDPAPPGIGDPQLRDRHGTAFRLDDHTLSFAELWYSPSVLARLGLPGTYKLGMWIATGPFADPLTGTDGLSLANPASNGLPLQHADRLRVLRDRRPDGLEASRIPRRRASVCSCRSCTRPTTAIRAICSSRAG